MVNAEAIIAAIVSSARWQMLASRDDRSVRTHKGADSTTREMRAVRSGLVMVAT